MPAVGLSEFASTGNKPLTERELRQPVQEGKMYEARFMGSNVLARTESLKQAREACVTDAISRGIPVIALNFGDGRLVWVIVDQRDNAVYEVYDLTK